LKPKHFDLSKYEDRQKFYQTSLWYHVRQQKLAKEPLCEEHLKKDLLVPATEVHHSIDIADLPTLENALDISKLVSLCKQCHSEITQKKSSFKGKPFNIKEFKFKQ
jgi:5-methylcytosine-specific restriction endonuclease McrA